MKKLTEKQIQGLEQFKQNGGTYVYLPIRKVYSTWYVRLFHVNNLLKENQLPSYWYRGLGDCTKTEAIKNGYESLIKLNWR